MVRGIYYNRTNTCDNIKEDGKKCENKLILGRAHRDYDDKGNWTGKWLCHNCYMKNSNAKPDSYNNLMTLKN